MYDFESLMEVVESLKELIGVVESCLRTEGAILKHIPLQTSYIDTHIQYTVMQMDIWTLLRQFDGSIFG